MCGLYSLSRFFFPIRLGVFQYDAISKNTTLVKEMQDCEIMVKATKKKPTVCEAKGSHQMNIYSCFI